MAAIDSSALRSSCRKIPAQSAAAPSPSVVHAVSKPNNTSRGVISRRRGASAGSTLGDVRLHRQVAGTRAAR